MFTPMYSLFFFRNIWFFFLSPLVSCWQFAAQASFFPGRPWSHTYAKSFKSLSCHIDIEKWIIFIDIKLSCNTFKHNYSSVIVTKLTKAPLFAVAGGWCKYRWKYVFSFRFFRLLSVLFYFTVQGSPYTCNHT